MRTIQLGSLEGGSPKPLFDSQSGAVVAGNYLIYVEDRPARLAAREFDAKTLQAGDRPIAVVSDDNVDFMWDSGYPGVSATRDTLVYTTGKFEPSQLTWFSRAVRTISGQAIWARTLPSLARTVTPVLSSTTSRRCRAANHTPSTSSAPPPHP